MENGFHRKKARRAPGIADGVFQPVDHLVDPQVRPGIGARLFGKGCLMGEHIPHGLAEGRHIAEGGEHAVSAWFHIGHLRAVEPPAAGRGRLRNYRQAEGKGVVDREAQVAGLQHHVGGEQIGCGVGPGLDRPQKPDVPQGLSGHPAFHRGPFGAVADDEQMHRRVGLQEPDHVEQEVGAFAPHEPSDENQYGGLRRQAEAAAHGGFSFPGQGLVEGEKRVGVEGVSGHEEPLVRYEGAQHLGNGFGIADAGFDAPGLADPVAIGPVIRREGAVVGRKVAPQDATGAVPVGRPHQQRLRQRAGRFLRHHDGRRTVGPEYAPEGLPVHPVPVQPEVGNVHEGISVIGGIGDGAQRRLLWRGSRAHEKPPPQPPVEAFEDLDAVVEGQHAWKVKNGTFGHERAGLEAQQVQGTDVSGQRCLSGCRQNRSR